MAGDACYPVVRRADTARLERRRDRRPGGRVGGRAAVGRGGLDQAGAGTEPSQEDERLRGVCSRDQPRDRYLGSRASPRFSSAGQRVRDAVAICRVQGAHRFGDRIQAPTAPAREAPLGGFGHVEMDDAPVRRVVGTVQQSEPAELADERADRVGCEVKLCRSCSHGELRLPVDQPEELDLCSRQMRLVDCWLELCRRSCA